MKDGIKNIDNEKKYKLDGNIFVGEKNTVMNNINDYYENVTDETADIIKVMQLFGAENIFDVLDFNSDGIVTAEELEDMSGANTLQSSDSPDTSFSKSDLKSFYENALAAADAIVEEDENIIKITYSNNQYTELKLDENGNVYSRYYEMSDGRRSVEYNTQDNSTTSIDFDSEGRPIKIFYDKDGRRDDISTYYTYNEDGSKIEEVKTIGKIITVEYDADENIISQNLELKYNSDGVIDDTKQQDETGDCWLLSGVNALRTTEKGQKIIKDSIKQNDDGSVTVCLKGVNKSYTYTPEDIGTYIHTYSSTGDNDMDIIEMAIAEFRSEKIELGTFKINSRNFELTLSDSATLEKPLDGGFIDEAIYYLTGINAKYAVSTADNEVKKELLKEYIEADKSNIAATISFTENDESIDPDITTGHAYSIVGADEENVYVVNPWDSGKTIAYPIDKISENISRISLTYLNEDYNVNDNIQSEETKSSTESEEMNKKENVFTKLGNFFKKIGDKIAELFNDLF